MSAAETSLRGEERGRIKTLAGFQKTRGHYEPEGHDAYTRSFVKKIGTDEVKSRADALYDTLRRTLGLKRKDLAYDCDEGSATIRTPDFEVHVALEQDAAASDHYVLATEVKTARRPEIVDDAGFLTVFSGVCDAVVMDFRKRPDLAAWIDAIEARDELAQYLDYPPDTSSFTLALPRPAVTLVVTDVRMTFTLPSSGPLSELIANTREVMSAMITAGVGPALGA